MSRRRRAEARPPGGGDVAVALRYIPSLSAPFLAAKGSGRVATRIEELAREAGVPIVEDTRLALSLYPLELGELVPEAYFEVVAKAFAFVAAIEDAYEEKDSPGSAQARNAVLRGRPHR